MKQDDRYYCRVCGLYHGYSPWGEDGEYPDYCICSCCGVEAGLGDETQKDTRWYRNYWLNEKKGEWWKPKDKPNDWNLDEQLKHIPKDFK